MLEFERDEKTVGGCGPMHISTTDLVSKPTRDPDISADDSVAGLLPTCFLVGC